MTRKLCWCWCWSRHDPQEKSHVCGEKASQLETRSCPERARKETCCLHVSHSCTAVSSRVLFLAWVSLRSQERRPRCCRVTRQSCDAALRWNVPLAIATTLDCRGPPMRCSVARRVYTCVYVLHCVAAASPHRPKVSTQAGKIALQDSVEPDQEVV